MAAHISERDTVSEATWALACAVHNLKSLNDRGLGDRYMAEWRRLDTQRSEAIAAGADQDAARRLVAGWP